MPSQIKTRLKQLPEDLRQDLIAARHEQGWSQAELGKRLRLPQMHVSSIETGKVVPRFDTLLEMARTLDRDLLMVPRELVPTIQSLVRDYRDRDRAAQGAADAEERPLYAPDEDDASGDDEAAS